MNQNPYSNPLMDALNIASFMIGMENLRANLTQNDKQDLINDLTSKTDRLLGEIHSHLEEQDRKIDRILQMLENRR